MFCEDYSSLIPLTFVLAFYVSHVVSRYWDQVFTSFDITVVTILSFFKKKKIFNQILVYSSIPFLGQMLLRLKSTATAVDR